MYNYICSQNVKASIYDPRDFEFAMAGILSNEFHLSAGVTLKNNYYIQGHFSYIHRVEAYSWQSPWFLSIIKLQIGI